MVKNVVQKGDKFKCKKTVTFEDEILYLKGSVYTSEVDDCITDESGDKLHFWDLTDGLFKYFELWTKN